MKKCREKGKYDLAIKLISKYKIDKTKLNRDLVSLTVVKSEDLNVIELFRFITYLQTNNLDADQYMASFHSRVASLFVIPIMCLFALQCHLVFRGLEVWAIELL